MPIGSYGIHGSYGIYAPNVCFQAIWKPFSFSRAFEVADFHCRPRNFTWKPWILTGGWYVSYGISVFLVGLVGVDWRWVTRVSSILKGYHGRITEMMCVAGWFFMHFDLFFFLGGGGLVNGSKPLKSHKKNLHRLAWKLLRNQGYHHDLNHFLYPIGSMYGIFTYIYHK